MQTGCGLQRWRSSSSPLTGTHDPCCNWRGEALPGHPSPWKNNAHTTHPSVCTEAEFPPNGIYTLYPRWQRSYLLGAWDPRPDSQREPTAPVALRRQDAVTPALYPYKTYPSEGKEGNTAPGRISFPGCLAVPHPQYWLDIMKVVAAAALCPGMEEIILEKWRSLHPRPRGDFLPHGLTTLSPFPASVPSLKPSKWMGECSWTSHL